MHVDLPELMVNAGVANSVEKDLQRALVRL